MLAACASACASPTPELQIASPDRASFELEVYPVLLRDCSFHACHGSSDRFFQVFGPGRERVLPGALALDPVDPQEVELSYQRARSMLDLERPEASLLLRKPLAVGAGGSGHQGTDAFGRDVYESEADSGYVVLRAWASSAVAGAGAPAVPATGATTQP